MALSPLSKGLLFAIGAVAAGVVSAYFMGVFEPYMKGRSETVAVAPQPQAENDKGVAAESGAQQKTGRLPENAPAMQEAQPQGQEPAVSNQEVSPPSFDLVRVEPDGSMVVAGRASANARVEILQGTRVLGTTTSGANGDFAAVLDEPLAPGDYQIVLRATTQDNVAANSIETAIVTVPDNADGQVLALVDRPGAPSKLITVPEAQPQNPSVGQGPLKEGQAEQPAGQAAAPQQPMAQAPEASATDKNIADTRQDAPADGQAAIAQAQPIPAPATQPQTAAQPSKEEVQPHIEAVEIDGRQIFVAGTAKPDTRIRVYANEILLGETETPSSGRFLIEAVRDLPAGDYIVRADMLSADGRTVIARAAVPFTRAEGEQVAAVAQPQQPAGERFAAGNGETAAPAVAEGGAASSDGTTTAPKLEPVDGSVIIRRGDTLWQISRRVYGRGVRFSTIYLANQDQISDPNRIWPGQVFAIPEKTQEGEAADMKGLEEVETPNR
ncbi:peptidoglycan-binding LysM [Nitratireductor indicus C115]|uniref:Peptidoglycan-binding LysM n=1 Tax=Nitratireductor indicus C115 TaxID=1231190 RepID=K2P6K6_9HYPH|nr:LysM peptidoglycan-binding domain-containing protein [Nitratireductor indicus]EKF42926.1 peptidoglycan-binding LysM [Nitratireductor indicus C115]SFQ42401.1 Nucleoid-associated protein YgaU, contains BON and LysM domains [Nitratireductor indicus]